MNARFKEYIIYPLFIALLPTLFGAIAKGNIFLIFLTFIESFITAEFGIVMANLVFREKEKNNVQA